MIVQIQNNLHDKGLYLVHNSWHLSTDRLFPAVYFAAVSVCYHEGINRLKAQTTTSFHQQIINEVNLNDILKIVSVM